MPSATEAIQVLLLLTQVHYAKSELRVHPSDTEAVVGQMTYLNCSTSIPSKGILWYHYPVGASDSYYIYLLGQLQMLYDERYRVEKQSDTGGFNLVIRSVETGDAGKYVCQEEGEQGQHRVAELIVLDANPVCGSNMKEDGIIGDNSCDVIPEEIQLSCTVSFHGNIPPIVEWREVGKNDTMSQGINPKNTTRQVTSFLTISGHQNRNGLSFACQTKRSTTKQNRCVSDGVKIIYVLDTLTITQAFVGENITCLANSSQSCVYKWKWFDDNVMKEEMILNKATIKFSTPGVYICEADCKIRQKTCSVFAKLVQVSSVDSTSTKYQWLVLVLPTSAVSVAVTIVVVTVVLNIQNRRRHQRLLYGFTEENEQLIPRLEIYGLTILAEKVYICRLHSADVEVYDSVQFVFIRRWRIQDLINPTDLISHGSHDLCLFDSKDSGEDCEIFRVTSKGELINKWSTGNNYWGAISASNELHIILTVYKTNTLIEYSSDGQQLLRQIVMTGAGIINPWHSIKLLSGVYVVCHGKYGHPHHRVCLVRLTDEINIDKDNVIKTFEGERGSSPAEMNVPKRLEVGANGSIYVADHHNGRVLVLDTELKLKKEHVSAETSGLRHPRRLQFDEANDRLLVSDYFRVLACQLSQNSRQWFDINPENKLRLRLTSSARKNANMHTLLPIQ